MIQWGWIVERSSMFAVLICVGQCTAVTSEFVVQWCTYGANIMKNQGLKDNTSRLFERGVWQIARHDGTGKPFVTKPNTTRKFAVELGSRKFGVGTPMVITLADEEARVAL